MLKLNFDPADRRRMNLLARKNRTTGLTSQEEDELATFIRVGHILGILKSKARAVLKQAGVHNAEP